MAEKGTYNKKVRCTQTIVRGASHSPYRNYEWRDSEEIAVAEA